MFSIESGVDFSQTEETTSIGKMQLSNTFYGQQRGDVRLLYAIKYNSSQLLYPTSVNTIRTVSDKLCDNVKCE